MGVKEQIKDIATYHSVHGTSGHLLSDSQVDQILDLVLNALTIEKKDHLWYDGGDWGADVSSGYNQAIDAYEELKTKLRK